MNYEYDAAPLSPEGTPLSEDMQKAREFFTGHTQEFWSSYYERNIAQNVAKGLILQKSTQNNWLRQARIAFFLSSIFAAFVFLVFAKAIFPSWDMLHHFNTAGIDLQNIAGLIMLAGSVWGVGGSAIVWVILGLTKRRYGQLLKTGAIEDLHYDNAYKTEMTLNVTANAKGRRQATITNIIELVNPEKMNDHSQHISNSYSFQLSDDLDDSAQQVIEIAAFFSHLKTSIQHTQNEVIQSAQAQLDEKWKAALKAQAEREKQDLAKDTEVASVRKEKSIIVRGQNNIAETLNQLAQDAVKTHEAELALKKDVRALLEEADQNKRKQAQTHKASG